MVITDIVIQNIKSIKNPLRITLDEKVTRISGRNTAGKTAVRDALSLFSGIHSPMDIKGLINRDRPVGEVSQIGIRFKEGTSLWAVIEGNTKVVYHWRSDKGETLKTWESWDEEVGNIVGWRSLQKEKLCFNIKKAKVNLLIDTSPTTNGNIVDYLCENKDLEIRISNLEEAQEELRLAKRTVKDRNLYYQNRFENSKEVDLFRVENLYKKVHSLKFTKHTLYNLRKVSDYKSKQIDVRDISKLRELLLFNTYIKLNKEKIQTSKSLEDLERVKVMIKTGTQIKLNKYKIKKNEEVENLNNIKVELDKVDKINKCKQLHRLKYDILKQDDNGKDIIQLKSRIDHIKDTCNVREYVRLLEDSEKESNIIKNISKVSIQTSVINLIREYKEYHNEYMSSTHNIDVIDGATKGLMNLSTINRVIDLAQSKLREIDMEHNLCKLADILGTHEICPLCNSTIDVEKIM